MAIKKLTKVKVAAISIILSIFFSFGPGYSFVFFEPEEPAMSGNTTISLEYDNVSNREMTFDRGILKKRVSGGSEFFLFTRPEERIHDVEIKSSRLMVKPTLEIVPWLDFFLKIGTADITLEYKRTRPGFIGQTIEIIKFDGRSDVAFGAGFKGKFRPRSWPGWIIMADVQILKSKHDGTYTWSGVDFPTDFSPGINSATAEIYERQAAISLAKVFGPSMIYAGAKYSDLEIEIDSRIESPDTLPPFTASRHEEYVAEDNIGVFIGTETEIIPNKFGIHFELRYLDETASSFGLNWFF